MVEYPALDKINGYYTNKAKKQLKANAQSMISYLDGGGHGYLGLVLSLAEYARW